MNDTEGQTLQERCRRSRQTSSTNYDQPALLGTLLGELELGHLKLDLLLPGDSSPLLDHGLSQLLHFWEKKGTGRNERNSNSLVITH
jgi:hypothetical protein